MEETKELLELLHLVAVRLHDNGELLKQMVRMTKIAQRAITKVEKVSRRPNLTKNSQQT